MSHIYTKSQIKLNDDLILFNRFPVKFNLTGTMKESFGEWLSKLRNERGLSQTELAERSQVTKATISLYEGDKVKQPRLHQLDKIAKALGVSKEILRGAFAERTLAAHKTSLKPKNFIELIQALEDLGINIPGWAIEGDFSHYTEDDFEELKERIAADTEITLRRKKK